MAVQYNSNIKIASPNPIDDRYMSPNIIGGRKQPYSGITHVNNTIPYDERHIGLPVNINYKEYWYKYGVNDSDLIERVYGDSIPVDDLITGVTNLGFFSGHSSVQTLEINTTISGYAGNYESIYNYFYRDSNGIIRLGMSSDGIPKRGYLRNVEPYRSWIWNESTDGDELVGWILVDGDVREMLGSFSDISATIYYDGITTFPYTNTNWDSPPYNNGSNINIFNVSGDLISGDIITVGAPIYKDTTDNVLNLRTIKSLSESLNIDYDDYYVYLSASTKNMSNVGAGVGLYKGESGNTSQIKTLIPSGSTIIQESSSGNEIIIHTTSSQYTNGYGILIDNNEISVDEDLFITNEQYNTLMEVVEPLIDSAITGATNGLSKVGSRIIKLGGNLTNNTSITSSMYNMTIDTNRVSLKSVFGVDIQSDEGSVSLIGNDSDSNEITRIDVSETNLKIKDSRDIQKGIEYDDKYHSGYTNRSLIDREYVDNITDNIISGVTFSEDIVVSIGEDKTFGKYKNGETIPASGKTPNWVILDALNEELEPTVNLTSSGSDLSFGETSKSVDLSFSHTINTMGATVDQAILEWRRGNSGEWVLLTDVLTTPDTFTHNINDSGDRFNTSVINYRYRVIDSRGASGETTLDLTPQSYVSPSTSISLNGTINTPENQNSREKGNVISSPTGSIVSNRSLVNITEWTLERRYDGGAWVELDSASGLTTQSVTIPSTLDDSIPTSAVSIEYRLTYVDEFSSGSGGNQSIGFNYFSYWGYDSNTSINESEIKNLVNNDFKNSVNLTWNDVASSAGNYTYYTYPSTYADISSIVRNGIYEDFGAWQKLTDVVVTNTYGESLIYKIWRTNATNAYDNDDLIIS